MKLKNNKGYVGIDASIAILILLIIVPTLTGMIYNVNKTNNLVDRKNEAVNIAVNTIEAIKGIGINGINDISFDEDVITDKLEEIYTLTDDDTPVTETVDDENTQIIDNIISIKGITLTKDNNTYKIEINIQDYADTTEGQEQSAISGKVKKVDVIVTYKSGKELKNIELSTVIS